MKVANVDGVADAAAKLVTAVRLMTCTVCDPDGVGKIYSPSELRRHLDTSIHARTLRHTLLNVQVVM